MGGVTQFTFTLSDAAAAAAAAALSVVGVFTVKFQFIDFTFHDICFCCG